MCGVSQRFSCVSDEHSTSSFRVGGTDRTISPSVPARPLGSGSSTSPPTGGMKMDALFIPLAAPGAGVSTRLLTLMVSRRNWGLATFLEKVRSQARSSIPDQSLASKSARC